MSACLFLFFWHFWGSFAHVYRLFPFSRVLLGSFGSLLILVLHYWSLLSGVLTNHTSFQFGMLMPSKPCHVPPQPSAAQIFVLSFCSFVQCDLRGYILLILWVLMYIHFFELYSMSNLLLYPSSIENTRKSYNRTMEEPESTNTMKMSW